MVAGGSHDNRRAVALMCSTIRLRGGGGTKEREEELVSVWNK